MELRGLPVDDQIRLGLDAKFDATQTELLDGLNARFPAEAASVHPKQGYKKVPKVTEGLVEREFDGVRRWCRLEPFSPNSSHQLLRYMKARKHTVPTDKKKAAANNDDGETTAKKELERLASKTGDDFYLRVIEYRELGKMRGTYIEGYRPHADGRVHTTFTFDTATGQLSSRNPNIQNAPKHGKLAKDVRAMIRDPDGRLLVEWDFKSYHVLTTGLCAEDADYMRLARLDMHSFIAGHSTKDWDAARIISESDEELLARFAWLKRDPAKKFIRDKKAKPTILGIGFGLGPNKLYDMNRESFASLAEAKAFQGILRGLFPKVFRWQEHIKRLAHDQGYLQNRFGMTRWFYEVVQPDARGRWKAGEQAEQAIAYFPASEAFGNIRECMKQLDRTTSRAFNKEYTQMMFERLQRLSLMERWRCSNTVHDSLLFFVWPEEMTQHIREIWPVMTAPSKVLRHPVLAPDGLRVDVEVSAGRDWAELSEVKNARAIAEGREDAG